jgi:hypothetical protein
VEVGRLLATCFWDVQCDVEGEFESDGEKWRMLMEKGVIRA